MTDTLKCCPFCGSNDSPYLDLEYYSKNMIEQYQVICNECAVATTTFGIKELAIESWNTRASGWISIKDRLPILNENNSEYKISDQCLVYCPKLESHHVAYYHSDGVFCTDEITLDDRKITHWMPLPSTKGIDNE